MKKVYDAVAVIGEYQNNKGETKKNYLNVGAVFENDKGALSLKLNAVPTSFNGWISFYVPKEQQQPQQNKQVKSDFSDMDSSIPF